MNESTPSPSRLLKASASIAQWVLWLLATAWLVLALAWGALHGWIVPRIGELRPDLEIEASRVLGVPVRIGSITAESGGLIPSFELADVVLLDAKGRVALRLPRVVAALTPKSLWNLGFEQLVIDRPELDIRRSADGRIHVAGLDFSKADTGDSKAAHWFFGQTELMVRRGTVRWTDELRAAPPLALSEVDFTMRNSTRRHAMRLDATPPPDWGDRFSLRGQFRQPLLSNRAAWQEWDGQLFADFARVDVSQLRRYANLGIEVTHGRGALRTWVEVANGQLSGAVADVVLADVEATLGRGLAPLALRSASGRLGGKRREGGFEFQTQDLQFHTREGQRWPGGNVFVGWSQKQGDAPASGELRADKLDLEALGRLASSLPLGTVTHAAIQAYSPRGMVDAVQANWQGPMDAPLRYEARGRASHLELASRPGVTRAVVPNRAPIGSPGVRGAAIEFDLTQAGGKARLAIRQGSLDFPGVFEEPVIALDELAADLQWKIKGEEISVSVANLKFANADAQGEGRASWRTSDPARVATRSRFPGVLDLQASISRADGARVYRYLPQSISKDARDYLREAVTIGDATGVKFRLKGDLHDFPFSDGKSGEFRVSADVRNATYAYVPSGTARGPGSWPALTQIAGQLVFERNGMEIKNAQGRFAGLAGLQFKAGAQIADMRAPTVLVKGEVHGPLSESVAFVNGSPLSSLMANALAKASTSGNADVRLQLELPLGRMNKSRVKGSVVLAGNDVQVSPDTPMLARARGVVNFNETGFSLAGVQARALGGDVRLEGGSQSVASGSNEPSLTLRAQGTASAEGLRQARELGFLSRLAKDASGSSGYNAVLGLRRGVFEVAVTSTLQGLALNLPAPLNKSAEQALPLRFENALLREPVVPVSGARLQDQLSLELGRVVSIAYVRDLSGPEPRVLRGAVGVGLASGESAPMPDQGVLANVNLASVDIDAWGRVLEAASGPSSPTARSGAGGAAGSQGYMPTVMAVRARELTLEGRKLHKVVIGGSRDGLVWRANVDAAELSGYVEFRQPSATAGGLVAARLSRLNIEAAAASEVEALLAEPPSSIPALDIVVDDFELRGKKLGRLEVDAVNRVAAQGVREWRLNKLNLTIPEAAFTANGNWVALNAQSPGQRAGVRPAERRRVVMNFRLDIADSGVLLTRFGMKDVVRRGKGKLEGQVAWLGSPLSLDYPSMSGAFNVNMEAGQFLKADPGPAKLLGVLSLQSLPRRLSLDFRDVFTEGFAFDFVRGDITIQQGLAATNNLQMKGVNAAVLMDGRADLAQETQDLKVVVIPEINAGTASLVASVINPAIGIATFLAQVFLRQPLMRAATQEFHIDGTWADPKISKLSRKAAPLDSRPGGVPQNTSGASN